MNEQRPFTVLGSRGWIGSALVTDLRRQGKRVHSVDRGTLTDWLASNKPSGPVIYAIGLTADFRQRPYATVDAHVGLLSKVLQRPGLTRLLLLSSTRVYSRSTDTSELAALPSLSSEPSDLYNLSKLLGEALVLQDSRPGFKVVRISNVIGPCQPINTFVGSLIEDARVRGSATILQPYTTTKNYIALSDVVRLVPRIAVKGKHRLYNLGSCKNTSHFELAKWLQRQDIRVNFTSQAISSMSFSELMIERLIHEFDPPGDPFRYPLF